MLECGCTRRVAHPHRHGHVRWRSTSQADSDALIPTYHHDLVRRRSLPIRMRHLPDKRDGFFRLPNFVCIVPTASLMTNHVWTALSGAARTNPSRADCRLCFDS